MNVFKRNSVHMAVLAGLGAMGVAGMASAVHVNPDGLGQVLIYPYYTVRTSSTPIASGQQNTYISVTNTTNSAKAVKVRFIEGKNSREVLDFNLFLSARDVWTGAVLPNSATASAGAKLVTTDKSCTYGNVAAAGTTGVPFSNLQYTNGGAGNNADAETGSLDRTNEGYVEIMEMGVITHAGLLGTITHASGVATCSSSILSTADAASLIGYLSAPTGGLLGGASLINTATGVDYSYDAVALDNWSSAARPSASTATTPTITQGVGAGVADTSNVFMGGTIQTATWLDTRDAVSAAIIRNQVMNEYVLDAGTASATDWVVTFPTKRFYVANGSGNAAAPTVAGRLFNANFTTGGSCDSVDISLRFDREEQFPTTTSGGFSPAAGPSGAAICWEANVISFVNSTAALTSSAILGSTNFYTVSVPSTYSSGWMSLGFVAGGANPALQPTTGLRHYGLPVVGFMVQDFVNSTIVTGAGAAAGAAHGGSFVHKYTRDIR